MSTFTTKVASAVSIVALTATTLGASVTSAASEFLPYAETLAAKSVINSTTEAGYRLNDSITRAELAKVAANLGGYTSAACDSNLFTDVNSSLGDLCDGITTLANAGVVSTSFSKFRPNDKVTRAEMTKIILGALGETGSNTSAGYSDVTASLGDLAGFINRANELKCARSATYFRPNASSSRGETFKIASCAAKLPPIDKKDEGKGKEKPAVTANGLNVTLEGNAIAQYVPMNASNVKVGAIKLTATDGDVKIKTITVSRTGLGSSDGMTIALGQNGSSVSASQPVNSSTQDAIIRLNNTLSLKKGESVVLDVLVSVEGTVNSQSQFTVKAIGTETSKTVSGLPVTLGLINTTSYEVSTVKHTTSNSINSIDSGKNDQKLTTVSFQAGKRPVVVNGFTLTVEEGDLDLTRALSNVKLYKDGTEVGTVSVESDKLVVSGLKNEVERFDTIRYELRADIIHVGNEETVKLKVQESADVAAIEKDTGYTTQVNPGAGVLTLNFKKLDITWTKNITKNITVAPGTSNVVLFDASLEAGADFDVTSFTLKFGAPVPSLDTLTGSFTSLTLYAGDNIFELANQKGNKYLKKLATTDGYTFDSKSDKFTISAGTPTQIRLVGNLANTADAQVYKGTKVTVNKVKNLSTRKTIGLSDTSSSAAEVKVEKASVEVKSATKDKKSRKISSNTSDVEIGRFAVKAKSGDIRVTKLTFENTTSTTPATLDNTLITDGSVKLFELNSDGTLGSEVSSTVTLTGGKIELSAMNINVNKDATKDFALFIDTEDNLTTGQKIKLSVKVEGETNNSTDITAVTGDTTGNAYEIGTIAPSVVVTKKSDTVFTVKVTNNDSDKAIVLSQVKAQVTADKDDFKGMYCLRGDTVDVSCTDTDLATKALSTSTGAIPGYETPFTFVTDKEISISENSSEEFEITVSRQTNAKKANLTATILSLGYTKVGGTLETEKYEVSSVK